MHALLNETGIDTRLDELPPLSPAIRELLALLDSGDIDARLLQQAARHEPVLAGRVLALANSPFYGFPGRIATLNEACLVLGSQTLRQLLLALTAMQQLPTDPALLDTEQLWQHSLVTAALARQLALIVAQDPEQAFTAGLLHDIGKLVLAAWFVPEYHQVQARCRSGADLLHAEHALLGGDHGLFGEKLLCRWHFPPALVEAIGQHHAPGESVLANLVHLADLLAHTFEQQPITQAVCKPTVLSRLGLDQTGLEALLPELHEIADQARGFRFC